MSDNNDEQDKPNTPPAGPPRFWGRPENDDDSQSPSDETPANESHTPPWEPPSYEPPAQEQPSSPPSSSRPPFQPPGYEPPSSSFPPPAGSEPNSGAQFPPPFTPPTGDAGNNQSFAAPFQAPNHKFAGRSLELRAMTVADILDNTFYLMRSNWKQLGIAALVYAVPAGALTALQRAATSSNDARFIADSNTLSFLTNISDTSGNSDAINAICTILLIALAVFLQPFVQGAMTRQVAAAYLDREMTAKEAFGGVRKFWWRFVGATFMVGLATIGGVIAFIVGAIVIAILFTVVIPVIAVEEETVFDAMGRSWALMKRRFWTYLGVRILMNIISTFVSLGVVLVPGFLALILFKVGLGPLAIVVGSLGSVFAEVVVFPIGAITATLIYFDARVRFEAFDVQLMSSRLPQASPSQPTSPNPPTDYGSGSV